ncbi:MAG: hypothetical protein ABII01_06765 [Candidatus Woesearchaeota archaeon]
MTNTKEKLEQGWINSRVIIEILGKPEGHVKDAMEKVVERIKNEDEIIITNTDFSDLEPQESMFSAFVEVEMLTKNIEKLVWFCFDFLPSSVEIIEPQEFRYNAKEFSNFLNDLQARLHVVSNEVRIAQQSNKNLTINVQNLLRNLINLSLKNNSLEMKELVADTGVKEHELSPFLDILIGQNLIKKQGDKFSFVKKDGKSKA